MVGTILVIEAKRTRAMEQQVRERVAAFRCICCDKQLPMAAENRPKRRRRGICTTCEGRWEAAKRGLTKKQEAELEARLISKGVLLAESEITQISKGDNPFGTCAAEVTAG